MPNIEDDDSESYDLTPHERELARKLSQHKHLLEESNTTALRRGRELLSFSREFLVAVAGFIGFIITCTLYISKIQNTIDSNRKEYLDESSRLREELERIHKVQDRIVPLVDHMDSLRQFGISNKEDYQNRKGHAPTILPD